MPLRHLMAMDDWGVNDEASLDKKGCDLFDKQVARVADESVGVGSTAGKLGTGIKGFPSQAGFQKHVGSASKEFFDEFLIPD